MNIFNSLGSNYDFKTIWQALTLANSPAYSKELTDYLEKRYQGKAHLLYKNREALRLGLEFLSLPKNSAVAICGYTCFVVDQAVTAAGYTPIYLDIDPATLNFSAESLELAVKANPDIKVVVVQNTLGYPSDIANIAPFCKKHKLILIEDLAHSAGGTYESGKEIGTIGELTILSFSQDKIIDAISGGALIVRNIKVTNPQPSFDRVAIGKQIQDRCYPFLTASIRALYPLGIGKYWHFLLKKLHLLSSPVNPEDIMFRALPHWQAKLAANYLATLTENIKHRLQISQIYAQNIAQELLSPHLKLQIDSATNLRFPIFTHKRDNLIAYMKQHGVHVSDIWYDTPISPVEMCTNAEKIAQTILNLPTHRYITVQDAKNISQPINQWLKSH